MTAYEQKVQEMREWSSKQFGVIYTKKVEEECVSRLARGPYRYCQLAVDTDRSVAPSLISDLAELAVSVGGYLTMSVHADLCDIRVAISRPLEEGE